MTDPQWQTLLRVTAGERLSPLPVGLIIDSPWLAGWHGVSVMDYFSDDEAWLAANLEAARRFEEVLFIPGFWAEYGMCTEPSAFGCPCVFPENELPFARKVLFDYSEVRRVQKPDCRAAGLCPFAVKRLRRALPRIERAGHRVRFASSRGPMNVATYLMGHTELLIGVKTNPAEVHRLLSVVADFVIDWLRYQAEVFPSIEGMLVLDDLIGFLGEADFREFAVPYFQRIAGCLDVPVKALHNDCFGLITAKHLTAMGFNLFNFSFEHPLEQVRAAAGPEVVLLGNVPPRDVLARGTPEQVREAAAAALGPVADRRRIVLSAGGGTPPGVPDENIRAMCDAAG